MKNKKIIETYCWDSFQFCLRLTLMLCPNLSLFTDQMYSFLFFSVVYASNGSVSYEALAIPPLSKFCFYQRSALHRPTTTILLHYITFTSFSSHITSVGISTCSHITQYVLPERCSNNRIEI